MGDPAGLAGVLVVLVAFGAVSLGALAGGAIEWLLERRERRAAARRPVWRARRVRPDEVFPPKGPGRAG